MLKKIYFLALGVLLLVPSTIYAATNGMCMYTDPVQVNYASYNYTLPSHGPYPLCISGVFSGLSGTAGSNVVTWTCNSTDGGTNDSCSGTKDSGGLCNYTYHGKTYTTQPADSVLCSIGTTTNVVVSKDTLRWECQESGFSNNSRCWATKKVNGACGSANGQSFSTIPTTNLCSSGGAYYRSLRVNYEAFTSLTTFDWVCEGQGGGTTAYCSATRSYSASDGKCGTSHGGTFATTPTTGLCAQGNPTEIADYRFASTTTWFWICAGNGGKDASCYAAKQGTPATPSCGSANYTTFSTWPADSQLCSEGSLVRKSGEGMEFWQWECAGLDTSGNPDYLTPPYGGRWASCKAFKPTIVNGTVYSDDCKTRSASCHLVQSAYDNCKITQVDNSAGTVESALCSVGYASGNYCKTDQLNQQCFIYTPEACSCGTANGVATAEKPTSNLCGSTNESRISNVLYSENDNKWHWECTGASNGGSCDCSAPKIKCGTANLKTYNYGTVDYGTDTQCNLGTSTNTAFPAPGTVLGWRCKGVDEKETEQCAASQKGAPVNGLCGTASGKTYPYDTTTYGTDLQCNPGTSTNTAFPVPGGNEQWYCSGEYDGATSVLCSASRATESAINGECGPATKYYSYFATAYEGAQCTSGEPSNTAFPAAGEAITWVCQGSGGGTDRTCLAFHLNVNPKWIEK